MSSKVQRHRLFYTPLLEVDLSDNAEMLEQLKTVIQERMANHPGLKMSNVGGWQSDKSMLQWGGEGAKTLQDHVVRIATQHSRVISYEGEAPQMAFNFEMWANVSPPGAANEPHAHPYSLWSAVYYVDDGGAPDTGPLILIDPRYPMNRMYNNALVYLDQDDGVERKNFTVLPEAGKLILFPSWLQHYVRAHSGDHDRMSIAMNLMVVHRW